MTPGINTAKKAKVFFQVHEYAHAPAATSYGLEAAEKIGVSPHRVFKTLVVRLDDKELAVGIVPVSAMLNMKAIAKAAGARKAAMADAADVQRATGYVLGGVSPLGQKKRLRTFIDDSATQFDTMFVSAGRRGLEIELKPADLARLTDAAFAGLAQQSAANR
ncbi:MAG: Cys-tRNA(Pro) deacylase [Zoogloeaceae bacterium]|nr:Cys-tRNA(Pro) deacylase [Zoogloeaceae bacterium]